MDFGFAFNETFQWCSYYEFFTVIFIATNYDFHPCSKWFCHVAIGMKHDDASTFLNVWFNRYYNDNWLFLQFKGTTMVAKPSINILQWVFQLQNVTSCWLTLNFFRRYHVLNKFNLLLEEWTFLWIKYERVCFITISLPFKSLQGDENIPVLIDGTILLNLPILQV